MGMAQALARRRGDLPGARLAAVGAGPRHGHNTLTAVPGIKWAFMHTERPTGYSRDRDGDAVGGVSRAAPPRRVKRISSIR